MYYHYHLYIHIIIYNNLYDYFRIFYLRKAAKRYSNFVRIVPKINNIGLVIRLDCLITTLWGTFDIELN